MRMKTIVMALVIAFSLSAGYAGANPPNAIHASYDMARQELNVTVEHIVTDRYQHFIKKIVISKDGKEVAQKEFDFQTSHRNQTMPPFKIPAFDGNTFKIVAICSISGEGDKTITVGQPQPKLDAGIPE